MPDIQRPADDPFNLVQGNWPTESESAYIAAETVAGDASASASTQSVAADDAARQTDSGMQGKTADSVSGGYSHVAEQLRMQSTDFTTIAGWMTDAAGKVSKAKNNIASLVLTGTQEIRDALDSETKGTPVSPSSNELITQYQGDIAAAASKLETDLDVIGHSLQGSPGSSRTPSYTSVPVSSSEQHHHGAQEVAAYNHGDQPQVTPQKLPPMPRATTSSNTESPSAPNTPSVPAAPRSVNPTLVNLIGGQGTPTGTPSAASPGGTSSTHASSQNSPSPQAHQAPEHHQAPKPAGLPSIPSVPLPNIPVAAAESIATAVSSAAAHQLPTAPSAPAPSVPASTGITPGTSGAVPVTPVAPTPLTPIGGGGLATPAVTQPAPPVTPASPSPAPQQTAPPRSPAADLGWIQRTYGLSPGIDLPKPDTPLVPALFVTDLPEGEAHLHRALATLRQAFDGAGWAQPLAVATIRRGFESKLVYVTADSVSIHPHGVLLPRGVTPLGEMPGAPSYSELSGSIMVTDKLRALVPRGWEVETLLSTVPSDENHQTVEQYQELVESGELLECTVSRGRSDVTAGEAMATFAQAALGSAGCSDLDVESARLRGSRWVGVQPSGYGEVLSRWYLADAAESMSEGRWGEAAYSAEKYLSVTDTKQQVA